MTYGQLSLPWTDNLTESYFLITYFWSQNSWKCGGTVVFEISQPYVRPAQNFKLQFELHLLASHVRGNDNALNIFPYLYTFYFGGLISFCMPESAQFIVAP